MAAARCSAGSGGEAWRALLGPPVRSRLLDQVWRWGRVYAGTTFVEDPVKNGVVRTLNWMAFMRRS